MATALCQQAIRVRHLRSLSVPHWLRRGYRVLCGREGIMEVVCRGAKESPKTRRRDRRDTSGRTQDANPFVDVALAPELVFHVTRWSLMQTQPSHLVVGGTLSEMAYAWQFNRLLIGMRCEGWSGSLLTNRLMSGRASRIPR